MTIPRIIIGTAAFVCSLVCAFASTLITFDMTEKLNEQLPKEQRSSPVWWYWSKHRRLWREYKRLYPEGNLLGKFRTLGVLMFVSFLIWAWALRLLPR